MENEISFEEFKAITGINYDEKDYSLITLKSDYYQNQKCPFCYQILKDGHKKDCMMYEPPIISIFWFILPIMLLIAFGYFWLIYQIRKYKKRK